VVALNSGHAAMRRAVLLLLPLRPLRLLPRRRRWLLLTWSGFCCDPSWRSGPRWWGRWQQNRVVIVVPALVVRAIAFCVTSSRLTASHCAADASALHHVNPAQYWAVGSIALHISSARFVSYDDLKIDCHESGVYFGWWTASAEC
jgi:hypothetical protein